MPGRYAPAFAVSLLATLASVGAGAQTRDNAEPLAAAAALEAAQAAGDRATLERLIAPDFLVVHGSGKVGGKADYIDGFARTGVKLETSGVGDRLFVRITPDVAIAGGEARTSGTEDGRRFTAHYRYARTFALRDGRWIAVFAQVTPLAP